MATLYPARAGGLTERLGSVEGVCPGQTQSRATPARANILSISIYFQQNAKHCLKESGRESIPLAMFQTLQNPVLLNALYFPPHLLRPQSASARALCSFRTMCAQCAACGMTASALCERADPIRTDPSELKRWKCGGLAATSTFSQKVLSSVLFHARCSVLQYYAHTFLRAKSVPPVMASATCRIPHSAFMNRFLFHCYCMSDSRLFLSANKFPFSALYIFISSRLLTTSARSPPSCSPRPSSC